MAMSDEDGALVIVFMVAMALWAFWAALRTVGVPLWLTIMLEVVVTGGSFTYLIKRWNREFREQEASDAAAAALAVMHVRGSAGE